MYCFFYIAIHQIAFECIVRNLFCHKTTHSPQLDPKQHWIFSNKYYGL